MKKLLIYRIGSLGDTIVALPSFRVLRNDYPEHKIILLTNASGDGEIKIAPSYQLLMGSGLIDDFIEYPSTQLNAKSLYSVIKNIRKVSPDITYYLMPKRGIYQRLRDQFFFCLAGIFYVRGLINWGGQNSNIKLISNDLYEYEAKRLMRSIGLNKEDLSQTLFSLNLKPSELTNVESLLRNNEIYGNYIVISLGTKMPVKDWGEENWQQLLLELTRLNIKCSVVCIGSRDEFIKHRDILQFWPGKVLNLSGKLSPRESAAVIAKAKLFIGHDSGPMHLASSVNVPSVTVFSSRDLPGIWFPFGSKNFVFYNRIECSGCKLNDCIEKKAICIKSIDPKIVAIQVKKSLNEY